MESPSRRRTYEFPKPDADLAEWTTKIKALQREVDQDEELEQRRLEEEIRASRIARARRSGGRFEGAEGARSGSPVPRRESNSPELRTSTNSPADRQRYQSEALRKLMGDQNVHVPSASVVASGESVSLASFIGGRATGPKLSRHAPQQDAHDPTQFEQRSMADIKSTPHPIFGSRGVAMPGMAAKAPKEETKERERSTTREDIKPSWARERSRERERTTSSPAKPIQNASSLRSDSPRIRTESTGVSGRLGSSESIPNRPPVAPAKPMALRKSSQGSEVSSRTSTTSISTSRPRTPPASYSSPASTSITSSPRPAFSPSPSPGLARPIQPQTRTPPAVVGPGATFASASKSASPAFLRPPPQKDLTPSLSRLQGRGFVQSFVKLSSELESAASVNSSASNTPEKSSPAPTKKPSVLDRWQPQSSSPHSPSAPPLRKAKTFDSSLSTDSPQPSPTSPTPLSKPKEQVKSASLPDKPIGSQSSMFTAAKNPRPDMSQAPDAGLGSSNTLFSYIKPTKTGDNPPTDERALDADSNVDAISFAGSGVDELGMRTIRPRTKSNPSIPAGQERARIKSEASMPAPSGRPLSHPTKDRARRPRKANADSNSGNQTAVEQRGEDNTSVVPDETLIIRVSAEPESMKALEGLRETSEARSSLESMAFIDPDPEEDRAAAQIRGENNIKRLQEAWATQGPIGVKETRKPPLSPNPLKPTSATAPSSGGWNNKATRHALPGLVNVAPPSPPITPPLDARQDKRQQPPPSPRHSRTPSTGTRPTVMDVAQAFSGMSPSPSPSPSPVPAVAQPINAPAANRRTVAPVELEEYDPNDPGGWEKTVTPAAVKAERRRSNYEKYSNFVMPVLKEEKTPAPSPANTLSKAEVADFTASAQANTRKFVDVMDEDLPPLDYVALWESRIPAYMGNEDLRTISVEVLSISGNSASSLTTDAHIFYDAETLAIIHRAKSKSSGLVVTKVWNWRGRKYERDEGSERKLQELGKRFNTEIEFCDQYKEPQELLHILGGTLAIRQGSRSLWSAENTTMHIVRAAPGATFIEEVDLSVSNLCSGFSFCISVLDSLWVWHGRGASQPERSAALAYAKSLNSGTEKKIEEVNEGEEDEMFWMFLGEDDYANADYWKWKAQSPLESYLLGLRVWKIIGLDGQFEVKEIRPLLSSEDVFSTISIVYLAFEVFVLVGASLRGHRKGLRLALEVAKQISMLAAKSKPFQPPVHVLIFPSRIPLELCAAMRGLDEQVVNEGKVPDHMNLISSEDALSHICRNEWKEGDLEDGTMLPLGVAPLAGEAA
ncbi:hypothetical protein SCHPADRAFT_935342 [Schizopora paradoxa]|uniref:Gelsolin-like domain-containing protein n=1 Tax=Schizopora paradoxa TaxID=27342 RepID=A0A0H2S6I2_9AGAM|nr:hypothetical protein SCHPADRAFT_935342 [Schizopora paradoxa]